MSDSSNFQDYFTGQECRNIHDVVTFTNLNGDASLVVPCPSKNSKDNTYYGHLRSYLELSVGRQQEVEMKQMRSMFATIAKKIREELNSNAKINPSKNIWLSTSGDGVPWLHFRLDSRPKYFNYQPYKKPI